MENRAVRAFDTTTKVVDSEYRKMFACDHVLVKIPKPNKYMRYDQAHKMEIKGKMILVPGHFVHGYLFTGTELIMYRHFYVSEEYLGKTITAQITLYKKVYPDNRVQYILDIKPQSGTEAQYELKIYTEKPNRNGDLGSLICIKGKAIAKIVCKQIPPRN